MRREDRKRVADVIESNTRRVSLDELALKGKRHVRVISGAKTLELIEAVVDKTIALRAGELRDLDRDRVVEEANEQFQRVARMQADAEALVHQQKELIAGQTQRIGRLEFQVTKAAAALKRRDRRLKNASETILNYDREIERLAGQVKADAGLIDDLRENLESRAQEVKRLQGLLQTLGEELAAARTQSRVDADLREEFFELKKLLSTRESAAGADLESRFEKSMERTLDRISKTLHSAVARPLDRPVEATDVVVSRIFDQAAEMDSNLSRLDVEISTTKAGIEKSLERLKRLREEAEDAPDSAAAGPPQT